MGRYNTQIVREEHGETIEMLIIIHGNVKLYDTLSRLPLVANFFDSLIVCSRVDSSVVWNNGKSQPVVS